MDLLKSPNDDLFKNNNSASDISQENINNIIKDLYIDHDISSDIEIKDTDFDGGKDDASDNESSHTNQDDDKSECSCSDSDCSCLNSENDSIDGSELYGSDYFSSDYEESNPEDSDSDESNESESDTSNKPNKSGGNKAKAKSNIPTATLKIMNIMERIG